jgi:hypothetical protein
VRCPACPLPPGGPCRGHGTPACEHVAAGRRDWIGWVLAGAGPEASGGASTAPIPLAGDLVAALTARVGADRLASWVAAQLGADCGCAERQRKLNELDVKLRRWLRLETRT